MTGLIILCFGGRDYSDSAHVNHVLSSLHAEKGIRLLIEGGAWGADWLCGMWADKNKIPYLTVEANWDKHGKSAGPIRNRAMARAKPDLGVRFAGNKGSNDMEIVLREMGIPILNAVKS